MTQKSVLYSEQYYKHSSNRHAKKLYGQLARIRRSEERQRRGSQYARDHKGEPGRNGGPKGM